MMVEKREKIRKDFNSRDDIWRIEAVIHDGNWYDIPKWKKVAKVSKAKLLKWIKENEDKLIKSELNSYRVGYDEIIRWYEENDLDLEESLVPDNFPPKLWGETTETDVFINAPRRRVGTVNFVANNELYKKCVKILKGVAKITPDLNNRYRAYGLSATHMKTLLSKGLTTKEFNSLDLKTRASINQRELIDLPKEWLEDALDFYVNTFAPSVLRSSMSTIEIYLPDRNDIHSQTVIWVITAMKKFDEKASVPFSGYLSAVLRCWPYNLPDEHLGKELSRFQRERKKAIDNLNDNNKNDNIPIEDIAEAMEMSLEEYIRLNNEHENWLAEKNATTLTWEDSSNEKKGVLIGVAENPKINYKKKAEMSLAAIEAGLETKDWKSTFIIIEQIDKDEIDEDIRSKLSMEFIMKFAKQLKIGD